MLLSCNGARASEQCTLPGKDVITFAAQKGFQFPTAVRSGEGSCIRIEGSFVISAGDNAESGVTCDIGLFAEKKTKPPWKIADVTLSGATHKDVVGSNEKAAHKGVEDASKRPVRQVQVNVEKGKSTSLTVDTVALVGGACEKWKEAF